MALLEVDPAQLVTPAPLITAESADENPNVCSAGASCSGRLPDVLGGRGERVGRPRAREGPAAPSSRPSSHRIPFPPIPDPSFTPRTSYYRWLRVAAPRRRRLRLPRLVTCEDNSHIMASVARGDEIIAGTTHSGEVIWVKIAKAHLSVDSPCSTRDCYAVCATLPTAIRESFVPPLRCLPGWNQPPGLAGHPGPRDKARPSRRLVALPSRPAAGCAASRAPWMFRRLLGRPRPHAPSQLPAARQA